MSAIFGETLTFPQENGPEVELVVFGDEFYARYETQNGYTAIYDNALGQYCYAILQGGELASSQVPISAPPPLGLPPHIEEAEPIRQKKFTQRYAQLRPSERNITPPTAPPSQP